MLKTVLTHWESSEASDAQLQTALDLVQRFDGHLTVATFGIEADIPPYAMAGVPAGIYQQQFGQAKEEGETLARQVGEILADASAHADASPLVSTYSGLPGKFGGLARFADLVVLQQPYEAANEDAAVYLLEGALFDGDAPVLVTPAKAGSVRMEKMLIAWNGTREALRAVKKAMPFLRAAKSIEITLVDPDATGERKGEDLALFLSRHGLTVELNYVPSRGQVVSDALYERCNDIGADLMVMGAYGHSRFREYVIGGATRDILRNVRLPVLMAH